jgi:hypothetical protein
MLHLQDIRRRNPFFPYFLLICGSGLCFKNNHFTIFIDHAVQIRKHKRIFLRLQQHVLLPDFDACPRRKFLADNRLQQGAEMRIVAVRLFRFCLPALFKPELMHGLERIDSGDNGYIRASNALCTVFQPFLTAEVCCLYYNFHSVITSVSK